MIEILVKVGERTNIIFNNAVVKPIRAITIEEVRSIVKNNTAVQYVVLEKVTEREYDQTREFIEEFESVEGKKVLFHVPDMGDEETNGIADELNRDVYLTLEKLHSVIYIYGGVDVSNRIVKLESNGDVFDTSFMGEVKNEETRAELIEEKEVLAVEIEEILEDDIVEELEEIEEPKVEEPKVEEPKIEEPKIEEPKIEEPKIEEPKIEKTQEPEIQFVVDESKIAELENEIEKLLAAKKELEFKLKEKESVEKKLDEANKSVVESEVKIEKINVELGRLANERDRYLENSNSTSDRLQELNDKLRASEEVKNKLNEKVTELSGKIEVIIEENSSIQSNFEKEAETRAKIFEEFEVYKSIKLQEIEGIKKSQAEEIEELVDAHSKELESIRAEEFKKLENEKARVSLIEAQLRKIEEERAIGEKPLRDRIKLLEEELERTEKEYNEIRMKYNSILLNLGGTEDGANAVIERNKELEELYQNKMIEVQKLEREVVSLRENEVLMKKHNIGLAKNIEKANLALRKRVEAKASDEELDVVPITYRGRAKVIPVFGSGSYGVTTMAVSTALSLSSDSRVLLIDFDTANPKMDAKLKVNPVIKEQIEKGSKNTALGILVEKDMDTFKDNYINIVKEVTNTVGRIHYLGGLYYDYSPVRLITAELELFINFLGMQYDYIVMDFGRLSDSKISTEILQAFSRIAYRNIAVTTNQKLEIRNMERLLIQKKLGKNTGFIINMAYDTSLSELDKKRIQAYVYGIVPFVDNFFGQQLNFIEHGNETNRIVAKDKLELFLNTLLGR